MLLSTLTPLHVIGKYYTFYLTKSMSQLLLLFTIQIKVLGFLIAQLQILPL